MQIEIKNFFQEQPAFLQLFIEYILADKTEHTSKAKPRNVLHHLFLNGPYQDAVRNHFSRYDILFGGEPRQFLGSDTAKEKLRTTIKSTMQKIRGFYRSIQNGEADERNFYVKAIQDWIKQREEAEKTTTHHYFEWVRCSDTHGRLLPLENWERLLFETVGNPQKQQSQVDQISEGSEQTIETEEEMSPTLEALEAAIEHAASERSLMEGPSELRLPPPMIETPMIRRSLLQPPTIQAPMMQMPVMPQMPMPMIPMPMMPMSMSQMPMMLLPMMQPLIMPQQPQPVFQQFFINQARPPRLPQEQNVSRVGNARSLQVSADALRNSHYGVFASSNTGRGGVVLSGEVNRQNRRQTGPY